MPFCNWESEACDVQKWMARAKEKGATKILVVYNTATKTYSPVFVQPDEDCAKKEYSIDCNKSTLVVFKTINCDSTA